MLPHPIRIWDLYQLFYNWWYFSILSEPGAYHPGYSGTISPTGPSSHSSGLPPSLPYRRYPKRQNRKKQSRNNQLSAPPDKDPVMLINEYGQKMSTTVKKIFLNHYLHNMPYCGHPIQFCTSTVESLTY